MVKPVQDDTVGEYAQGGALTVGKAVSAVLNLVVHTLVYVVPVYDGRGCACGRCTQLVGTVA